MSIKSSIESSKLTEVLVIRLTKELKDALDKEAKRLKVRTIDVIRMSLAKAVENTSDNKN